MKIASPFQNHMVLQRDQPIPVWGSAAPGASVSVRLEGATNDVRTVARSDGAWKVSLPPCPAGGPYTLAVEADGETIRMNDVMTGEVWICSGQSNMEWPVSQSANADEEIAAASYPHIRLLSVPKVATMKPTSKLAAEWQVCTPDSVPMFSAVGYYFARELHRELDVAVGVINSSWGGTVAEAWVSRAGLETEPALRPLIHNLDAALGPAKAEVRAAYMAALAVIDARALEEHKRKLAILASGPTGRPDGPAAPETDVSGWAEIVLPNTWQNAGYHFSGVFWFRKDIEIPAAWAGQDLSLNIGACDKDDITFFNNERVGSMTMAERPDSWCALRRYTVPGRLVKPGRNVLAVRVHSNCFAGGMTGPKAAMWVAPPNASASERINLDGAWKLRVELDFGLVQPPAPPLGEGNANTPTAPFTGMIAPLAPYGIRGAIWYQGESNVDRATEYRTLLPALIRDWRRVWGQGEFPFHIVQLANFISGLDTAGDSPWAELREAQRLTAERMPHVGQAVILDVGNANDIHPINKQDVGRRLARLALKNDYGRQDVVPHGPAPRSVFPDQAGVRIVFDAAGLGLKPRNDVAVNGIALAGADRVFHAAEARVTDRETVTAHSAAVPDPRWVRYAWADNPVCNLTNSENIPGTSFDLPVPSLARLSQPDQAMIWPIR